METEIISRKTNDSSDPINGDEETIPTKGERNVFDLWEDSVFSTLQTYSNVHRGNGHFSMITTRLYERAREVVLEHLELDNLKYIVVFCTSRGAGKIIESLNSTDFQKLTGSELGLSLGVSILAIKKCKLPAEVPFLSGGGNARLVDREWVVWAKPPERFEAGTPAVINIVAFTRALQLTAKYGKDIFQKLPPGKKVDTHAILYRDEFEGYTGNELLEKIRHQLAGQSIQVPTANGEQPYIHFDYAASTPALLPAWDAFRFTLRQQKEVQQEIIQEVKTICAGFFGAAPEKYDVIFTSNTTEAINLAAESFSRQTKREKEFVVLSSLLEHSSNDLPWRDLHHTQIKRLSFNSDGFFDLGELENLLKTHNGAENSTLPPIRLVAVTGASNVHGTYNNLEAISRIVHKYGAEMLVDAAQMAAHRTIDMQKSGIDYLAFSAHKMYAPFGSGGLVVRKGLLRFRSEEWEQINRSGEQNPAGIAALGKAMALLQRIGMEQIQQEEKRLTTKLLNGLAKIPGVRIFGINDSSSPEFASKGGVIPFEIKEMFPPKQARLLSEQSGIGVRHGCHCAHIAIKKMVGVGPVLAKFQRLLVRSFPKLNLPGVVRASIGIGTTEAQVEKFLSTLEKIARKKHNQINIKKLRLQTDVFIQTAVQRILG